jgi:DNA-binding MarR family transcriptional regulator
MTIARSSEHAESSEYAGDDPPQISDAELVAAIRVLGRVTRVLGRLDTGLSFPQYRLLTLLAEGNERSTALAQHLAVSKPTITSAVEALVELGHLHRLADTDDRRVTWLQITASGTRALARANTAYVDRFGPTVRAMDDPAAFVAQLSEFNDVLNAERERSANRAREATAKSRQE